MTSRTSRAMPQPLIIPPKLCSSEVRMEGSKPRIPPNRMPTETKLTRPVTISVRKAVRSFDSTSCHGRTGSVNIR